MTDKIDEIINDALGVKDKEIVKSEPRPVIPRPAENEEDYKLLEDLSMNKEY